MHIPESIKISKPKNWWGVLEYVIVVLAVGMVIYQLLYAILPTFWQPMMHDNMHLLLALVITFLVYLHEKRKRWWPVILAFALIGAAGCIYVFIFFNQLLGRTMFNTVPDLIVGVALLIMILEATRESFGWVMPIFTVVFIAYVLWGYLLPGALSTMHLAYMDALSRLTLSLGWGGIYGSILDVSASYIFLFMIFAAVIQVTGAVGFFTEIGKLIGRKFRAGPALATVVSSGLIGSISGSVGANVMLCGSFTIPAMKGVGYTPEQAGAIEAASSTGGPIIPPVMGTVAFLIPAFTGIAYAKVALYAIIPALLYMLGIAIFVILQGEKMQVAKWTEEVDKRELLLRAPTFLLPLATIIVLFIMGYTTTFVGFWAVIVALAVGMIRKKTRPSLKQLIKGLTEGAKLGSAIGVTCAGLAVVTTTFTMTGLGLKLPVAISDIVGNNLLLALVLTGIVAAILGMGLQSSTVYIIVVIALAPVLTQMGVSIFQAHMFTFFITNTANVTPPVAIAALFASKVAQGSYMKTGWLACAAGIGGFLVPFFIVFVPALTFNFSDPVFALLSFIGALFMLLMVSSGFVAYFFRRLSPYERVFEFAAAVGFFLYMYDKHIVWFVAAIAITVVFITYQFILRARDRRAMRAVAA